MKPSFALLYCCDAYFLQIQGTEDTEILTPLPNKKQMKISLEPSPYSYLRSKPENGPAKYFVSESLCKEL